MAGETLWDLFAAQLGWPRATNCGGCPSVHELTGKSWQQICDIINKYHTSCRWEQKHTANTMQSSGWVWFSSRKTWTFSRKFWGLEACESSIWGWATYWTSQASITNLQSAWQKQSHCCGETTKGATRAIQPKFLKLEKRSMSICCGRHKLFIHTHVYWLMRLRVPTITRMITQAFHPFFTLKFSCFKVMNHIHLLIKKFTFHITFLI